METIIYQGQPIQATLVNYISGRVTTSTVDCEGDEDLFRDEVGRYYLRRKLTEIDSEGEKREASRRTLIHRINVNAAILWATTRLNSTTLDLRCDAAKLLMEGRGYVDPNPVHLTPAQRAELRTGATKETDGSMAVTIRFAPACAALLRAASERLEQSPVTFVYQATESGVRGLLARSNVEERRMEDLFDDNAPEEREEEVASSPTLQRTEPEAAAPVAEGSDRIVVELDDLASAMLRNTCMKGDACHRAGEDLRDLVNAAVTFALCDDRNEQHGEFDLSCGDQALERAKRDRLRLEADAPMPPPPPISGHVDEPEAVETQPGVHRFVFDYPAARKVCGRRRTIELSDEQMERVKELATHFALTPFEFLHGLADRNVLPGQPRQAAKLESLLHAENIAFACRDEAMAKRIARAAQARQQTPDEFVAHAIGTDVDMWEEIMLVHPVTGELLEAEYEELFTEVEREYEITAPPIGHEHERQFWLSLNRPATLDAPPAVASLSEHAGSEYGVSVGTLAAAGRYAAKHGRTVDEFIVDALELAASDDAGALSVTASRHRATPNPAAVALLAAAPPEEEPLPEEVHTDEPEAGANPQDGKEAQ